MNHRACTSCRSTSVQPGFLEDMGENSMGHVRWIPGQLQRGIFGGAKRMGKERFAVAAVRCRSCEHLDLYVEDPRLDDPDLR